MGQASTRPQTETGGEDKTGKGSIRGRVVMPGGGFVSENIKVTLMTINGTQGTIFADSQGWLEFPDLTPGNYEVQVEASRSQLEIISQSVQVFRGAPSIITVSLREKDSTRNTAKSISVGELSADVPKAARKEFELATKAAQEKRTDDAIAHLRKAIGIYPNFVMALNDLGTQLLAQGKLE